MSTRKSHVLFVYVKVKWFRFPMLVPVRVIWECIDALEDIMLLCGKHIAGMNTSRTLRSISEAVTAATSLGAFDLVDVEAGNRVSVKIGLW